MSEEIKVDRILPEHLGWEARKECWCDNLSPRIIIAVDGYFFWGKDPVSGKNKTFLCSDSYKWFVRPPQPKEKMPSEKLTYMSGFGKKEYNETLPRILDDHEERIRKLEKNENYFVSLWPHESEP